MEDPTPAGPSGPAVRPGRAASLLAIFVLAVVAVNVIVERNAPPVFERQIRRKYEAFRDSGSDVDLITLGSSFVERGINPVVFDRVARQLGHPLRSYNFGVAGLSSVEIDALLDEILALDPPNLKWIVIDAGLNDLSRAAEATERNVWWHDLAGTRNVIGALALEERPVFEKLLSAIDHLGLFFRNSAHFGMGPKLADAVATERRRSREGTPAPMPKLRGFIPLTDESKRAPFLENVREYRKAVETMWEEKRRVDRHARPYEPIFRRQVARLADAGVGLIYLIPPNPVAIPELAAMHERGEIPHLLSYNDPAEYPEFFAIDTRFDANHLVAEAATRYTEQVARDVVAILESGR